VVFALAAILAIGRTIHWLIVETNPPFSKFALAPVLFAIVGLLWITAYLWAVRKHDEAVEAKVQATHATEMHKVEEFLTSKTEEELRETFDINDMLRFNIKRAKLALQPALATAARSPRLMCFSAGTKERWR
jgi:hypothetical protein